VGGAGQIVVSEELPDGRFDIVLEGNFRYRVLAESGAAPYRVANVEEVESVPFASDAEAQRVSHEATSLFREVAAPMELPPLPDGPLSPEHLGFQLALRLRYEPAELQALLEMDSIPARLVTVVRRMQEWQSRIRFLSPYRREADPGRN